MGGGRRGSLRSGGSEESLLRAWTSALQHWLSPLLLAPWQVTPEAEEVGGMAARGE